MTKLNALLWYYDEILWWNYDEILWWNFDEILWWNIMMKLWWNIMMKLNASKTKTMIVSRSRTMHPQSPPLAIGGTVPNKSDDLVILWVTFDLKMTFEKHLRSVSRAASQRLGILSKSWRVFHDRALVGDAFGVLSCQFWNIVLHSGARLPIHTLNYWTEQSVVPGF